MCIFYLKGKLLIYDKVHPVSYHCSQTWLIYLIVFYILYDVIYMILYNEITSFSVAMISLCFKMNAYNNNIPQTDTLRSKCTLSFLKTGLTYMIEECFEMKSLNLHLMSDYANIGAVMHETSVVETLQYGLGIVSGMEFLAFQAVGH